MSASSMGMILQAEGQIRVRNFHCAARSELISRRYFIFRVGTTHSRTRYPELSSNGVLSRKRKREETLVPIMMAVVAGDQEDRAL